MNYVINRTKRSLIILSALLLILNVLFFDIILLIKDFPKPGTVLLGIKDLLSVVAHGYLLFIMINFFIFQRLTVLKITTIILLLLELISLGCKYVHYSIFLAPPLISYSSAAFWIITIIVWTVFLFKAEAKEYPAILSLRKYAVTFIFFFILGAIIPYFVTHDAIFFTFRLLGLTMAIPYIFFIDFGLKLPLKSIS